MAVAVAFDGFGGRESFLTARRGRSVIDVDILDARRFAWGGFKVKFPPATFPFQRKSVDGFAVAGWTLGERLPGPVADYPVISPRKSRSWPQAKKDRTTRLDKITTRIIDELEAGRVRWVQPWGTAAAKAPLAMPNNAATCRAYCGINILILWGAVTRDGFPGQSWLTFRQALALGGNVRKGERGTTVVCADRFILNDEKQRARLRFV